MSFKSSPYYSPRGRGGAANFAIIVQFSELEEMEIESFLVYRDGIKPGSSRPFLKSAIFLPPQRILSSSCSRPGVLRYPLRFECITVQFCSICNPDTSCVHVTMHEHHAGRMLICRKQCVVRHMLRRVTHELFSLWKEAPLLRLVSRRQGGLCRTPSSQRMGCPRHPELEAEST